MNTIQLEEEEKVLIELLKWSGGPEDDQKYKAKSKVQAYVLAVSLFVVASIFFYIDAPSKYQIFGGLSILAGFAFLFMANVISGTTYNLKYTKKYIDTESIRARLKDIKLNKPKQQRPSGWSH